MSIFFYNAILTTGSVAAQYGYVEEPPVVIPILASDIDREAGTSVENGRYIKDKGGIIEGIATPKRDSTLLSGSSGTGTYFNIVNGGTTWKDGIFNNQYHIAGVEYISGAISTSPSNPPEIVNVSYTDGIEHSEVILRKTFPPVADGSIQDQSHKPENNYFYLHLAYQSVDKMDYRIAGEYGKPIRLDISYDGGTTWDKGVVVWSEFGNLEQALAAHNNELRIQIKPSYKTILGIQFWDGDWKTHKPDASRINPPKNITSFADSDPLLPKQGKWRLVTRNGSCAIWICPYRHSDPKITKTTLRDFGRQRAGLDQARIVQGGITQPNINQTMQGQVTTDGQKIGYTVTAKMPDAGDGLGSKEPATFADLSVVIPARWSNTYGGLDPRLFQGTSNLPVRGVSEIDIWDDLTNTVHHTALVEVDNSDGQYTNAYGNFAVQLQASDGGQFYTRMTGVTDDRQGGVMFNRRDPQRTVTLPICDKSRLMDVSLPCDVVLDGYALSTAIRLLCEYGNIHSSALSPKIPFYLPPGTDPSGPYAAANYDANEYILGRGTGNAPRFRFPMGSNVWQVLQTIISDMSAYNPVTGRVNPYFFGFDEFGIFHAEPYNVFDLPLMASFHDGSAGSGAIQQIQVSNSAIDMRSHIDLFGLDGNSFELLWASVPLPSWVAAVKGFRDTFIERNARFASQEYLIYVANLAAEQASRPVQHVQIRVPFNPALKSGALIQISEQYCVGRTGFYIAKQIQSEYRLNPDGTATGYSIILARNVESYF